MQHRFRYRQSANDPVPGSNVCYRVSSRSKHTTPRRLDRFVLYIHSRSDHGDSDASGDTVGISCNVLNETTWAFGRRWKYMMKFHFFRNRPIKAVYI